MNHNKLKNLFLRQSYLDAWEDYNRSIKKKNFIKWDYIVLTASNEIQAEAYKAQLNRRLQLGQMPRETHYAVLPDPEGKRVGSGGATFQVLRYIGEQESEKPHPFKGKRILVIHSGGDSKRVPQYSALGKLFSPMPRELPDGRNSTLFDEFMIGMSGVPSRIQEGMLVLSGDVLLLFNPLQIDSQFHGAAAISMKESVSTGKDHGVFLNDGKDYVKAFLHKQSEKTLREIGAVNADGNVDLDTGAILLDCDILQSLYSLITTDGKIDEKKFYKFCNEESCVSFYGDFLFPLAKEATLEQYYQEAAENTINEALLECRKALWEVLHPYSLKLLCLSPAKFIHFGTTWELWKFVTKEVVDYEFLDWKVQVGSAARCQGFASHNAYVGRRAAVGENAYLENCYILGRSQVGKGSMLSHVRIFDRNIPENVVMHGMELLDGKFLIRVYGREDNPKKSCEDSCSFLGTTLNDFIKKNELSRECLWDSEEDSLWKARLYPVCETQEDALNAAEVLLRMAQGTAGKEEIDRWKCAKRLSLCTSYQQADITKDRAWERELEERILTRKFIWALEDGAYYRDALNIFGTRGITKEIFQILMEDAGASDTPLKIRIYYALSRYMKTTGAEFYGMRYDALESKCFGTIQAEISKLVYKHLPDSENYRIAKEKVDIALPVRVNWGGGWTDTPPYCNECGGVVLNAALKLNGIKPVQVTVKKLEKYCVQFESADVGVYAEIHTAEEIQDCSNPYDPFALHKAALIACGIIPAQGKAELEAILKKLGGGIYLSTQVEGVPKGSGLGTSSILSGACVKGLFSFLGREVEENQVYEVVLAMEQIMSTGGGWQDQIGGLTDGIKFIVSKPGMDQQIKVEKVEIPEEAKRELSERFALIYTGQRRLARNLLRDVVGGYIGSRPDSLEALKEMKPTAALMKFALEQGNIDEFARLLDRHWELSCQLDAGSTNTCIDQILLVCEGLIDGRFIAGAGGGGFIQVILKKGVTKRQLRDHLHQVFQDSGVDVWDCELLI